MMKILGGSILLGFSLLSQGDSGIAPPEAKRVDHREVRHGATVVDPYHWIREKSNPDVVAYLEAENAYTEAMTKEVKPFG